jgi:hypothetical protein
MIEVELSSEPLKPGESRRLRAWSDAPFAEVAPSAAGEQAEPDIQAPMSVAIECFVEPPRPAQLRPCSACGTFPLRNGEEFHIQPDEELFKESGGYLKVFIRDVNGDKFERKIQVPKTSGLDRSATAVAG